MCIRDRDVGRAMLEMNRARAAVETNSTPVPELEGKNVGCGADLQHHRVSAAAMDGAGRDEKVIVFLRWKSIGKVLRGERSATGSRRLQIAQHRRAIHA